MSNLLDKIKLVLGAVIRFINTAAFTNKVYTTDNKTISYTDIGSGTPIVLIHAFPADKDLWIYQRQELQNYFRIITLDLWGFGQSSPTDGKAITMDVYADEVSLLLESLHIDKAVIGGESMGGYIALAFLKKYPNKVTGLILSNTQAIADTQEAKQKREVLAVEVLDKGSSAFIDGFIPKAVSDSMAKRTKHYLLNMLKRQSSTAIASGLRGMALREDSSDILAQTLVPILIITSDQDKVINNQQSTDMHNLAKNSELQLIKNAGHLSNLEQPELWNKAVIKLFTKS